MTINANELALLLRGGMAAKQADLLAAWIVQTQTVLDAVGLPILRMSCRTSQRCKER